jgi:hypothetical protein
MMLINNANAYKLRKNDEKALEILKQEDWSAVSNEFLICVAAIKDEVKEVCSLIRSGSASKDKLRNWPVFQALRSNEEFAATFESHFREPLFVARTNKASAPDAGASEAELAEC